MLAQCQLNKRGIGRGILNSKCPLLWLFLLFVDGYEVEEEEVAVILECNGTNMYKETVPLW